MVNFNTSRKPEYNLFKACTREMIDLYGVKCKLALVKKVGVSAIVNGWTSIKTDGEAVFEVNVLLEQTEAFDTMDYQFGNFGFLPSDSLSCFIAADALNGIVDTFAQAIGNLIVLPSSKVMEIADVNIQIPQVNNLFAYPDDKTVYQLRLVPYKFKLHDHITDEHLAGDLDVVDPDAEIIGELKTSLYKFNEQKTIPSKPHEELEEITKANYKVLDNYLETLDNEAVRQDLEVLDPDDPIYDTSEPDVWHRH